MRILQLIDSLEAGGAERMAVNYANALQKEISFSALCATRKEGALKESLSPEVSYIFLDKKKSLDFKALFKLRSFVKANRIEFIHAHSSSFFMAVLLKFIYPRIKIIWHDHFGARYLQQKNKNLPLKLASLFFSKVMTINFDNKKWLEDALLTKEIEYFPNFIAFENDSTSFTKLKGESGKRIVFLANLKKPKNHIQFLKAFHKSEPLSKNWSLHLIGKDYQDDYSKEITEYIAKHSLEENVFIYGSCTDTFAILSQADIGVLCSTYEGFPVTLLEYGYANLAVLSTNVGFCSTVIEDGKNGLLFSPTNELEIIYKLNKLSQNSENIMATFAQNLNQTVNEHYTDKSVLQHYLNWLIVNWKK